MYSELVSILNFASCCVPWRGDEIHNFSYCFLCMLKKTAINIFLYVITRRQVIQRMQLARNYQVIMNTTSNILPPLKVTVMLWKKMRQETAFSAVLSKWVTKILNILWSSCWQLKIICKYWIINSLKGLLSRGMKNISNHLITNPKSRWDEGSS